VDTLLMRYKNRKEKSPTMLRSNFVWNWNIMPLQNTWKNYKTYEKIKKAFGNNSLSHVQIFYWYKMISKKIEKWWKI